ncbi:hypothetical protein GCM10022225_13300 [Plantactinospora mayteni]|uniref:Glycosyltransferase n=1 Tax=Plantactinospora mayteni TaxID=566021 RepID=A0ABQ4EI72_9ACTN|nr:glycosyltransferase family 1 protein [Plantactinospora mayteni]GIG93917.1 hypothetical protein Pma05_04900 [Plantactinospora mayteni]
MINVLIVAGTAPRQDSVLADALERFRREGVRVRLIVDFDLSRISLDPALAELRGLRETEPDDRLRRAMGGIEGSRAVWVRAWHDRVVRQWVHEADVLVSMDMMAVYAVWEMGHRRPDADACHGVGPAARAVQARLAGVPRPKRGLRDTVATRTGIVVRGTRRNATSRARRAMRIGMAPAVMRSGAGAWFWRTAVAAPALPDRIRTAVAYRVHQRTVEADRPQQAAAASAAAAARLEDPRARATLLNREASWELAIGHVPVCLREAVAAELAVADEMLRKKSTLKAAHAAHRAMKLLFHRVVHFEQPTSPLAENPAEFLAPLWDSATGRALAAAQGRAQAAATPPTDRPLHLLILTNGAGHPAGALRQRYDGRPDVHVRYVDLGEDVGDGPFRTDPAAQLGHLLAGSSEYGNRVREWLRPHLEWADIAVADRAEAAAAMTLVDPGDTRIVVCLPDFELLGPWPQLTDFSRVDELVLSSTDLLDLATTMLPRLRADQAPELSVVGDAPDLRAHQRPKDPAARYTLGLLGTNSVDARWAVEVLRRLRATDPRYRLFVGGDDLTPPPGASVRRYHEEILAELAELERSGAVTRVEQVADVPEALTGIGVILGSPVRETFHHAHIEGAASGATPILRNWPILSGTARGVRTLVPAEWVADTPEQAVRRILDLTATEQSWRDNGAAAAAEALATWGGDASGRQFDELLRIPLADPVG